MGVDIHGYVGPYFKTSAVDLTITDSIYGCGNPTCERYGKNVASGERFCSACGTSCTTRQVQRQARRALCLRDFDPGLYSRLHEVEIDKDVAVWMPDHKSIGKRVDIEYENCAIRVDPAQAAVECKAFRAEYQDIIETARERFGVELQVEYGMVTYWS